MVKLWNLWLGAFCIVQSTVLFIAALPMAWMRTMSRGLSNGRHTLTARVPWSNGIRSVATTPLDGMPVLPPGLVQYAQLPSGRRFTATTIPKGLLHEHSTKRGTWGVIRVSRGQLEYQIHRSTATTGQQHATVILDPRRFGIIEPSVRHQVRPLTDDVEFVVEFHKLVQSASSGTDT